MMKCSICVYHDSFLQALCVFAEIFCWLQWNDEGSGGQPPHKLLHPSQTLLTSSETSPRPEEGVQVSHQFKENLFSPFVTHSKPLHTLADHKSCLFFSSCLMPNIIIILKGELRKTDIQLLAWSGLGCFRSWCQVGKASQCHP